MSEVLKSKFWQGYVPSGSSKGKAVSLPFPASRSFPHSTAHDSLLTSASISTSSTLTLLPLFHLYKGPCDDTGLTRITSIPRSLLWSQLQCLFIPSKVQGPGIRTWIALGGPLFCLPNAPYIVSTEQVGMLLGFVFLLQTEYGNLPLILYHHSSYPLGSQCQFFSSSQMKWTPEGYVSLSSPFQSKPFMIGFYLRYFLILPQCIMHILLLLDTFHAKICQWWFRSSDSQFCLSAKAYWATTFHPAGSASRCHKVIRHGRLPLYTPPQVAHGKQDTKDS